MTPPPSAASPTAPDPRLIAARACPAGLGMYDLGDRFQLPPHLQILDKALCDVAAGRIKRLIIEMPPRHGKSMLTSEYFPAWFLMRWPDLRVMLASYGAELASEFGGKARDLVVEHGQAVGGVTVNPAKSAAHNWKIRGHRGGMTTAGVGGAMTGKGADVLIIDDPVKNHEEAQSQTHRESVWNWYTSTAYTRIEPNGAIIIIQTRWHEDDLAGRAQTRQADEDWTIIRMPAVCDDPERDPLGRAEGEALWPRRFSAQQLARMAKAVGSFVWRALYQQRPVAAEGNLLRRSWWQFYTEDPRAIAARADEVIQTWDMAFKDTDDSDYVVGQVWARIGADRYLLDQVRARMDFPTTKRALRALTAAWPMATVKLVEDKANGTAVMADLKHEIEGLIAVEPQGGKVARVVAASPVVESGNVYLPDRAQAPWVDDFLAEAAAFPNGAHDDQVDAFSQAIIRMKTGREPAAATNPFGGSSDGRQGSRSEERRRRRLEEYWGSDDEAEGEDA